MAPNPAYPVSPAWHLLLRDLRIAAGDVLRRAGVAEDLFAREHATVRGDEFCRLIGPDAAVEFAAEDAAAPFLTGVSARTLQRRLTDEGTSFQPVLDGTREELARHYLGTTAMAGAEISFLLGFEEPSSFVRAFHDWTGVTPEQMRNQLRRQEG